MDCCKFYKVEYHVLVLLGLCLQVLAQSCGTRPLEQFLSRTPFIVGGRSARFGEIPWQVGLFYNGNYYCGGALIGTRWVITAGHCAKAPPDLSRLAIRIGEYDLTSDYPKRHIQVGVESRIIHESFSYQTVPIFDIALLKLDKDVKFEENIQPICIPNQGIDVTDYMGTIAGWGKKSYNGVLPNILQMVGVKIISSTLCEQWIRAKDQVTGIRDDWLCAGFKEGGKDACQGDSGSPLTTKLSDGNWYIVGISSSGFDCAKPMLPGIYTHVSLFSNWIKEKLQQNGINTTNGFVFSAAQIPQALSMRYQRQNGSKRRQWTQDNVREAIRRINLGINDATDYYGNPARTRFNRRASNIHTKRPLEPQA